LAEAWVAATKDISQSFKLIMHIGCANVEDSKELARHAESIGVPALACTPPVFFKPETMEDLVVTMQSIASAAPTLPFYYYHIPSRTGVSVSMYEFFEAAHARIPTLVGMKYTHWNMIDFADCLKFDFTMSFERSLNETLYFVND
jgi:N-acetylneuraminate lyase